MARYVAKRLVAAFFMALAASLLVFFMTRLVPADPLAAVLGEKAAQDPAIVAAYRARWHLDRPLWEQYVIYLDGLVHGNLGVSIVTQHPVAEDIATFLPATLELGTAAGLLAVLVGVPLGIVAAVRRDSWLDHLARFISLIGVSAPTFWLAFIVLALFYGALGIAPGPGQLDPMQTPPPTTTGAYLFDAVLAGDWAILPSLVGHLILPSVVLAASTLALITRTTRAAMLEGLGEDFVRTARAKGLRESAVIMRHVFRNALIPVVTLGGVTYAQLISGAVMTETIFGWPGVGRYAFQASFALDFPAITGITLVVSVVYLMVNIVVDVSYAVIDPRVARR